MAKDGTKERFGEREAQQRLEKSLRAALSTPPKPRLKAKTQKAKKKPGK